MKSKFFISLLLATVLSEPMQASTSPQISKPNDETKPQISKQINLNTANADALLNSVKGIGKKRAEAIVKYREAHNGFKTVDELSLVPGLGKTFVAKHANELKQVFTFK